MKLNRLMPYFFGVLALGCSKEKTQDIVKPAINLCLGNTSLRTFIDKFNYLGGDSARIKVGYDDVEGDRLFKVKYWVDNNEPRFSDSDTFVLKGIPQGASEFYASALDSCSFYSGTEGDPARKSLFLGNNLEQIVINIGEDTYVSKDLTPNGVNNTSNNYGQEINLSFTNVTTSTQAGENIFEEYSLIKFNLPNLGDIASASLIINSKSFQEGFVGVYKILKDWNEDSATWNNTINDDPFLDSINSRFNHPVDIQYREREVDITSLVRDWNQGEENYGLIFGVCCGENNFNGSLISSEHWNSDLRPRVIIEYVE